MTEILIPHPVRREPEPYPPDRSKFLAHGLGKVIPYGIYDVGRNQGWVSVGIDHDTSEFAVDSILAWWRYMGCKTYPQASMADAGGRRNGLACLIPSFVPRKNLLRFFTNSLLITWMR
jgi:Rhodopirellula transposase DDE domain